MRQKNIVNFNMFQKLQNLFSKKKFSQKNYKTSQNFSKIKKKISQKFSKLLKISKYSNKKYVCLHSSTKLIKNFIFAILF